MIGKAGVPCSLIYTLDRVFADPQVLARGTVFEADHPRAGRIKQLSLPCRFRGYEPATRSAPPLLGQHTDEILTGLGYTNEEIRRLRTAGTIGQQGQPN